jgi:hypothetical protein
MYRAVLAKIAEVDIFISNDEIPIAITPFGMDFRKD